MADVTSQDFPRSPVERLAQRLLAEARARPSLTERDWSAKASPIEHRWELPRLDPYPNLTLLSDPSLDVREYLEDLVSLAARSARQAEDMSHQSREASRKMRRSTMIMAGFGVVGLLVGVMGFTTAHKSRVELTAMRQQMSALEGMQHRAQEQLSDIASAARSKPDEPVQTPLQAETGFPATATTTSTSAPLVEKPVIRYSEVWPDSRPPQVRRTVPVRSHVVVPVFVAQLQRNISALFR